MQRTRNNLIPGAIAFSPTLWLPLVQNVIRPHVSHATPLGFILSWIPDFIVGFCFPFASLIRPSVWSPRIANILFNSFAVFTVVAITFVEYKSPFGHNVFDPWDLIGGVSGVMMATMLYYGLLRNALTFEVA